MANETVVRGESSLPPRGRAPEIQTPISKWDNAIKQADATVARSIETSRQGGGVSSVASEKDVYKLYQDILDALQEEFFIPSMPGDMGAPQRQKGITSERITAEYEPARKKIIAARDNALQLIKGEGGIDSATYEKEALNVFSRYGFLREGFDKRNIEGAIGNIAKDQGEGALVLLQRAANILKNGQGQYKSLATDIDKKISTYFGKMDETYNGKQGWFGTGLFGSNSASGVALDAENAEKGIGYSSIMADISDEHNAVSKGMGGAQLGNQLYAYGNWYYQVLNAGVRRFGRYFDTEKEMTTWPFMNESELSVQDKGAFSEYKKAFEESKKLFMNTLALINDAKDNRKDKVLWEEALKTYYAKEPFWEPDNKIREWINLGNQNNELITQIANAATEEVWGTPQQ